MEAHDDSGSTRDESSSLASVESRRATSIHSRALRGQSQSADASVERERERVAQAAAAKGAQAVRAASIYAAPDAAAIAANRRASAEAGANAAVQAYTQMPVAAAAAAARAAIEARWARNEDNAAALRARELGLYRPA